MRLDVIALVLAPEGGGWDGWGGDIPMRFDVVALVLADSLTVSLAVSLMTLDVLLLVDPILWPLFHLNASSSNS
jgi:hypothetical protein